MTYRKAKAQIKKNGWTLKQVIHENGIMRLQVVTKKGKPKTMTVDN